MQTGDFWVNFGEKMREVEKRVKEIREEYEASGMVAFEEHDVEKLCKELNFLNELAHLIRGEMKLQEAVKLFENRYGGYNGSKKER